MARTAWRQAPLIDVALSCGTGDTDNQYSGWFQGSIPTIIQTFLQSLDSEKEWKQFLHDLEPAQRHRYHRINMKIDSLPDLDDTSQLDNMKKTCQQYFQSEIGILNLNKLAHSWLASLFYFEFHGFPADINSRFQCSGKILCKISDHQPLRRIIKYLNDRQAYLKLEGCDVCNYFNFDPCSEPTFCVKVDFQLESLHVPLMISLVNPQINIRRFISGLPRSSRKLLDLQGLRIPVCSTARKRKRSFSKVFSQQRKKKKN